MRLSGTYRIPAARERVFAALTDPEILQRCIEGCEQLTLVDEHTYDARIRLGVGALKGTYVGRAQLRDLQPPESFALVVEGKGGGGFVSGDARMTLIHADGETDVLCEAQGHVGGVIAAVGSRLVEAAGKQMMNRFFRTLSSEVTAAAP
jgi:carbon monoxide dehydrogenase subunit G